MDGKLGVVFACFRHVGSQTGGMLSLAGGWITDFLGGLPAVPGLSCYILYSSTVKVSKAVTMKTGAGRESSGGDMCPNSFFS